MLVLYYTNRQMPVYAAAGSSIGVACGPSPLEIRFVYRLGLYGFGDWQVGSDVDGGEHGRCGMKAERTVLTGFEGDLDELLRKGVTNSSLCLERILAKGYAGGLTAVKGYISASSHLLPAPRRAAAPDAARGSRYETTPGEAHQMDWEFVDAENPAGGTRRMVRFAMVCHH